MNRQYHRRINKSFSVRLDLLEELERRAPRGERSAFLEEMLIRELTRPSQAAKA
jgi:hypothetical protein